MAKYAHTKIEFYSDLSTTPLTGFVLNENGKFLTVKVEHGEHHGEIVDVHVGDVIDETFDNFDFHEEKIYAWYDAE